MRNLGEQWIEIIDGQEHMVRAVEKISEKSYDCTGCIFNGHNGTCMYHSQDCPLGEVEYGYIKDLGILKCGLLPCPFCVEYPEHQVDEFGGHQYFCDGDSHSCRVGSFLTIQQSKDEWNRRA